MLVWSRIVVGLVGALTIVGSGYEMLLERRKTRELRKKQISQGNNNEGDSKAEFTLDKMHAMEKIHMKDNENKVFSEEDFFFKGNCTQSRHC